jgi:hypothetical protein
MVGFYYAGMEKGNMKVNEKVISQKKKRQAELKIHESIAPLLK